MINNTNIKTLIQNKIILDNIMTKYMTQETFQTEISIKDKIIVDLGFNNIKVDVEYSNLSLDELSLFINTLFKNLTMNSLVIYIYEDCISKDLGFLIIEDIVWRLLLKFKKFTSIYIKNTNFKKYLLGLVINDYEYTIDLLTGMCTPNNYWTYGLTLIYFSFKKENGIYKENIPIQKYLEKELKFYHMIHKYLVL